jgi:hypothetical protein
MIFSNLVTHILWWFSIALEIAIVFGIVRRKLLLTLPFFFSYILSMLCRDIVLVFINYPGNLYARIYWYGEVVTVLLALAVIFETARYVFPQYSGLKLVLKVARALGAIGALVAILMMFVAEVTPEGDHVFNVIILAERSVKFVEVIWLILVITVISHYGSSWRQCSVGIVAGLGVHAALTLAVFELRTHANFVSDTTFVLCNLAAYNAAAMIWTFFFLGKWRSLPAAHLPEANLSEWNDAVTAYTQQWYRRY